MVNLNIGININIKIKKLLKIGEQIIGNSKKVIISGAGIAGLSAGCYLQMNGYDTEIY